MSKSLDSQLNNRGDNMDAIGNILEKDGITMPNEDNINIDSYLNNIPEEMRGVFIKMRETSKNKTATSEKELGIKAANSNETEEFEEIVMDEEYLSRMRLENAKKEATDAKSEGQPEMDDALNNEKQRLKELEENPDKDPILEGMRASKQANRITSSDNGEDTIINADVGEVLGDNYIEDEPEAEEDEAPDELKSADFLPDLDDDEVEEAPQEPEPAIENQLDEDASDLEIRYRSEEALEKIIRDTPEVVLESDQENNIVKVSQKRTEIIEVPGNNSDRVKELSDDAFLTRINKIRRKNFRVVDVPLLNSGFVASMNGISPGDLIALYNIVDQHNSGGISAIDYLNAQMKAIAKSIVKLSPNFDKNNLHYMIHYADLNLLMYGVVAATLDDAKYPINACAGCGKSFRITIPSNDIILNKEDVAERATQITNATDIKETSLLERNTVMKFPSGFEVVLSHASIADQRALMIDIDKYSDNNKLTEIDKMAILDSASTELPWIKSIVGPGNIKAKGPFQITKLLGVMDDDERRQIIEAIRKMQKELVPIKLGVKNVKCPHCGHVHEQIPITSLSALVFFHRRERGAMSMSENA